MNVRNIQQGKLYASLLDANSKLLLHKMGAEKENVLHILQTYSLNQYRYICTCTLFLSIVSIKSDKSLCPSSSHNFIDIISIKSVASQFLHQQCEWTVTVGSQSNSLF